MKTYAISVTETNMPDTSADEEGNKKYASDRVLLLANVDTIKQIKDLVAALHE